MSYASIDDSKRTFTDDAGRTWAAERIGRTSGIVATKPNKHLPQPSDIVRFTCTSHEGEPDRETTIQAGDLEQLEAEDLKRIHKTARIVQRP